MAALVEGRPPWEFGIVIHEAQQLPRVAVFHRPANVGLWVEGSTEEARLRAAQSAVDEFYMKRWIQLSEIIQADDVEPDRVRIYASGARG